MLSKLKNIIPFVLLMTVVIQTMPAQVSEGGKPFMNSGDFTPAKVIYVLPPVDPVQEEALKSAGANGIKKSLEFAIERPVDLDPDWNGQWVSHNQYQVWRAHIISPGARSLGVVFDQFRLQKGVRLFIYNPEGNVVKGAYTSRNNKSFGTFYAGHVPGDEVILELQADPGVDDIGEFRVAAVSHAILPVFTGEAGDYPYLGSSQDCEVDVNCAEGEEWQTLKRSVCHIVTTTTLCTGVLVNNTAYNGKPYILTAEHCINAPYYARNSIYIFGYENSECGKLDGRIDRSVAGATLLSTGDSLDFSLLQIDGGIPHDYEVYYAGWDLRPAAFDSVTTLHHPNADAMKISVDYDFTGTPTSVPGNLADYIVSSNIWIKEWDVGTTEGGSSGSPLFYKNKRLIGTLSGGLAVCGDSIGYDATKGRAIYSLAENQDDYYSRISYSWDHYPDPAKQLKAWLDPVHTGVLSIGGMSQSTLGISNRTAKTTEITVYPNPAKGRVRILVGEYTGMPLTIGVYDATGRKVLSLENTMMYPVEFDTSALLPGIYYLSLEGKDKRGYSRLIVK